MSNTSLSGVISPPDTFVSISEEIFEQNPTKVFLNHINSYHGKAIAKAIREIQEDDPDTSKKYWISGTVEDSTSTETESQADEIINRQAENFHQQILNNDFIIFDLNFQVSTVDDVFSLIKTIEGELEASNEFVIIKHLILISNPMTWARTDSTQTVSDKKYRMRRPHSCYRRYLRLEQDCTNLQVKYQGKIRTLILNPGVTVGYEEDILHYFFKMALYNKDDIEIFEPGDQKIPILHVDDLAQMVLSLIENYPLEGVRYITASQPLIDFHELVLSVALDISGPDAGLKIVPKEQIFLLDKDLISQRSYDKLNLNLNFGLDYFATYPFYYPDLEELSKALVKEYYDARQIKPIKVIIHGPPISGKTTLAQALACYYSLYYINLENILEETKLRFERKIKRAEQYIQSQSSYEVVHQVDSYKRLLVSTGEKINIWRNEIIKIDKALESKNTQEIERLKETHLTERLHSNACSKNQGYVIDGMLMDIEAVKRVFLNSKPVSLDDNDPNVDDSDDDTQNHQDRSKLVRVTSKVTSKTGVRLSRISFSTPIDSSEEVKEGTEEEVAEDDTSEEAKIKPDLLPTVVVYLKFDDKILEQQERCTCRKNQDRFPLVDSEGYCTECSLFLSSSSSSSTTTTSSDDECLDDILGNSSKKNIAPSELLNLVLPQGIKAAVRSHEQNRLAKYRETEYEDKSFYTFCLDCGILPYEVVVNKDTSAQMVYNAVKEKLGPRNEYLINDDRKAEEKRIREELKRKETERHELEIKKELERQRLVREKQLEEELDKKMELKRKELRDIERCSIPLEAYLIEQIVPNLKEALVEVAHIRPEDPIDYLAESLFRNNPNGNLFDPSLSDRHIQNVLKKRLDELYAEEDDVKDNACPIK